MQKSIVYFTKNLTSEGLIKIYEALGKDLKKKVAVKISTGEPGGHNFLNPKLIEPLVTKLQGTIVECCTAYRGKRFDVKSHWQAIKDHGFMDIAPCDIMDEDGEIKIPLQGGEHLNGYDIVGSHIGLPFMIAELSVFSLVSGLFSKKISIHSWLAIPAVLLAILAGRLSFLGLVYIFEGVSTLSVNLIWSQILSSYPGILLQLILVPAIIILLNKILNREEK